MAQIGAKSPRRRSRVAVEPVTKIRQTLGLHYRRKLARYDLTDGRYDTRLTRVFATPLRRPNGKPAASFLREVRPQLERLLVRRARLHPYVVEHALNTVTQRTKHLDLRLARDRRRSKRDVVRLLERVVLDVMKRNRENYAL